MKFQLLTPVETELEEAFAYYEGQQAGLGLRFISEFNQTLVRIRHYPQAWSPLSSQVRRCQVNRFPYSVIYEVRKDVILIAALQHHHREPNSWRSRLT